MSIQSPTNASNGTTDFTLSNGEQVSLADSGRAAIHVTDSGVGMTENQMNTVFMDGVQFNVNKLQAGQGSGLGLYIAKGIVQQHGGTLTGM